MLKTAFSYVKRNIFKTIIIFLVLLLMSGASLIALSIRKSVNKASEETFKNINNSFIMEINRQVNPGTPRGGGNVKGEDIKKITDLDVIENYVKRINSVANLDNLDIIETPSTLQNQSEDRREKFGKTVMLTGVNDSSKETKFISEEYKLKSGEHLTNDDKNKILMHEELAKKNNLSIGDKIKLKSNIYDPDNEKMANETVEVEIKGLFEGNNKTDVTYSQELYQNTLITDLDTAAKVYGNSEETAVYQDATFFVRGDIKLDNILKELEKLDINWNAYNLIKSSSNYPALQSSISGVYNLANKLLIGSLIFFGVVLSLLLFLWINARRKEVGILLSIGLSKFEIFIKFLYEILIISIPSFIASYFLSVFLSNKVGDKILSNVTSGIEKNIAKQMAGSNFGGGAEAEGFNKTLKNLSINIEKIDMVNVIIFTLIIIIISVLIASISFMKKNPKDLLTDLD